MHWSCVTGLVVYPPTGSKADRQGDEHPAYAQHWVRHLYLPTMRLSLLLPLQLCTVDTLQPLMRYFYHLALQHNKHSLSVSTGIGVLLGVFGDAVAHPQAVREVGNFQAVGNS